MNMQKKLFKNIDPVKNARSLNFTTSIFLKKSCQNVENKKVLRLIFKCMPIKQFLSQMLHFYVF